MDQILAFVNQYKYQILVLIVLFLVVKTYGCQKQNFTQQKGGYQDYITNTGILPDGKYAIRGSRNQRFCTDDPNGMICNRDEPGPWEMFTVQHLKGENYAIQGYRSGNWCSLTSTGMRCEAPVVGDWEVFKLHPLGNGKYGIQSNRNLKWCVDSGHGLVCDVPSMYGWDFQEFEFLPIRYNNIK